ncbi:MAG: CBS domain-containing protein [Chloroflexota bacterium]|nr:CBS domain-containing protein [Chloroflexota bacterium]
MKNSDIMTKDLVYSLPGDMVSDVAKLMKDEDIGPVLIVDDSHDGKRLVGIVTDRDLAIKVVGEGRDPKSTRVEDVMTGSLVTCRADDDVQNAIQAMSQNQLRRIPVVDDDGQLVGIISQADVATRLNEPQSTAEVVKEISRD